jgi:hypothetical protein
MADVENQSTTSELNQDLRPKSWALTTEGVLWGSALWISLCSSLTLLFGIENDLVSKHISATLCATSLLMTFLLFINHNRQMCFSEKYGQKQFSCSFYSMIASFAIFTNLFSAILISVNTEDSGIATFVVVEMVFLAVVYAIILFYKSNPERVDGLLKGCMPKH